MRFAFDLLSQAHRDFSSPVPDFLAPPIEPSELDRQRSQFGFELPIDLIDAYEIANGVDLDKWRAVYGGTAPYLIPAWDYPPASYAIQEAIQLRAVADKLSVQGVHDMWREDWIPVLTRVTTGDEHIAIAANEGPGELWHVYWEGDIIRKIDYDLAALLEAGSERFAVLGATWDEDRGLISWEPASHSTSSPLP